jgi:glutamate formiminotransferase / 5-formyltetrahydrofolate cyclo-ligase
VLLAVPNFSEGRDRARVESISTAFATGAALLDTHSDDVHNRTVLTLSGPSGPLAAALVKGAQACVEEIDMRRHEGAHPRIGALDVCPVVWLHPGDRELARSDALGVARAIAAKGIPVFLYGELASEEPRRERAFFRDGGLDRLRARMASGEVTPDFGPSELHTTAGATLVTARAPLAAFNILLVGGHIEAARAVAARLRESGGGLPGVRAIGVDLGKGRIQVSTNVHDPTSVPLAEVLDRIRELAVDQGTAVASAEIVGLVPEAALAGWPEEVPIEGFDPDQHIIERRTGL